MTIEALLSLSACERQKNKTKWQTISLSVHVVMKKNSNSFKWLTVVWKASLSIWVGHWLIDILLLWMHCRHGWRYIWNTESSVDQIFYFAFIRMCVWVCVCVYVGGGGGVYIDLVYFTNGNLIIPSGMFVRGNTMLIFTCRGDLIGIVLSPPQWAKWWHSKIRYIQCFLSCSSFRNLRIAARIL